MSGRGGRHSRRRHCAVLVVLFTAPFAPHAGADPGHPLTGLVDAAAQRLALADPVAAAKWTAHGAIEGPARVRQELAKLAADATARHIDSGYATRIFGDQINATEAIEYSRFAEWKLDPGSAPAGAPGLSASRSAIDALNQTMLTEVVSNWNLLHSPACAAELDAARTDVAGRLDDLCRRALSFATRSYCQQ